jgi:hypothetical protein
MILPSKVTKLWRGVVEVLIAATTLCALNMTAVWAQQASCSSPGVSYDTAAWSNPHPSSEDVILPLGTVKDTAATVAIVLRKVTVSGASFFGDEKAVFRAGAEKPTVFEARIPMRAASVLSDAKRQHYLLVGKYEISIAQYAFVVGKGDLVAGVRNSSLATTEPFATFLAERGDCAAKITDPLAKALALPVTGLRDSEYRTFITAANEMCFAQEGCSRILADLSNNPQIPANLRLPAGHEWEFVARGGSGDGPATIRPAPAPGQSVHDIANIAPTQAGRGELQPIGATQPYLGLYDVYGNASELTLGYFLAENVSGGVGGLQARGGNVTTLEAELRPSAVEELRPYMMVPGANTFVEAPLTHAGLRLLVSAPLASSASRIGSDELVRVYAAAFSEIGTGKDRAGNGFVDAKPMREMKPQAEPFEDELDSSDPADFFRFPLTQYSNATARVSSSAPVVVEVYDEARRPILSFENQGGGLDRIIEKPVPGLLPGKYYVSVKPKVLPAEGSDIAYDLTVLAEKPVDTGLGGIEIGREAFSGKQQILTSAKLNFDGYVGADDPFDTYPVELADEYDAVSFTVGSSSSVLEINVLDSRGQKLLSRMMDGSIESSYPVPLPAKAKVFFQVAAVDGQPTRYSFTAIPAHMFDKSLSVGSNLPRNGVTNKELAGYLHEGAKSLYYRTYLSERKRLRVELTGLDMDIDLAVLDAAGQAIASNHRQVGAEPEIFIKDLPAGDYLIQLNRKSGPGTLAPFNLAVFQEQAVELSIADLKGFKDRAKPLAIGPIQNLSPGNGVVYYYFEAPRTLLAYDISVQISRAAERVTLETVDGTILAVEDRFTSSVIKYFAGPSSGRTYIRFEFQAAAPTTMTIWIRNAGDMPVRLSGLEGSYKSVEKLDDWTIGQMSNGCFAFSHAIDLAPAQGWVKERPYFWISVDMGGNGAGIDVATENDFDPVKTTSAKVRDSKGRQIPMTLLWSNGSLRPVVYNKVAKKYFLNNTAIRQIVAGQELEVNGTTKSGLPAKLSYSLKGIGGATRALVKLCKMKSNVFN